MQCDQSSKLSNTTREADGDSDMKMPAETLQVKNSVHFYGYCECCEIPSLDEYSQKDIEALWWQDEDYDNFTAHNNYVADLMTSKDPILKDEDNFCVRGLEWRVPIKAARRVMQKTAAIDAVLDEQDFQIQRNIDNPEDIAAAYLGALGHQRSAAHFIALKDQQEAEKIRADDEVRLNCDDNNEREYADLASQDSQRSHRVRFNPTVSVETIEHINDLSEDYKDCVWYKRVEITRMKSNGKSVYKLLKSRQFQEDDEYILRGLEYLIPTIAKRRKHNKAVGRFAVFDEQDRQDEDLDPEDIAEVYKNSTKKCVEEARLIGQRDEKAIQEYYTIEERNKVHQWNKHIDDILLASKRRKMCPRVPRGGESTTGMSKFARSA